MKEPSEHCEFISKQTLSFKMKQYSTGVMNRSGRSSKYPHLNHEYFKNFLKRGALN